jgi:catechol 2,3-dioxygenase-like lactoylglutathione lyase family enzyme
MVFDHIGFNVRDFAMSKDFYLKALAPLGAGGRDNGPPGLRTNYHPSYYGAYVFDLDGHNLEAVCHAPE